MVRLHSGFGDWECNKAVAIVQCRVGVAGRTVYLDINVTYIRCVECVLSTCGRAVNCRLQVRVNPEGKVVTLDNTATSCYGVGGGVKDINCNVWNSGSEY